MQVAYSYAETLARSTRVCWQVEDIIGGARRLDFTRRLLPEALADVEPLSFLGEAERRTLNQIRAHSYLCIFGLVEEFILPFVLDHARARLFSEELEIRALLQFASEEAKHIDLFKRFAREFREGFGHPCRVIGPPEALAEAVLAQDQLGVALAILHIEWMTQRHYVESAQSDESLDPQFKSLLKHHWLEEAQHAKLDTLIVGKIAERLSGPEIQSGLRAYEAIGKLIEDGLLQQAQFDLESFQGATGRELTTSERARFIEVQSRSYRTSFLEAGATHPKFVQTRKEVERMGQRSTKISEGVISMTTTARSQTFTLNGFDLAAIQEEVATIAKAPEKAIAGFRVRSEWKGGAQVVASVDGYEFGGEKIQRHHRIVSDEPKELFGTDRGPNPQELLFAALNACMIFGYATGAAEMGIELDRLSIETEGHLDVRGALELAAVPPGFPAIQYVVRVKANATPEQLEALHRKVMRTSPNFYHLTSPIRLEPKLVVE